MQIPEHLRPFEEPTLIVVTDHVHAKLYRAVGRDIEAIETITTKADLMPQERHEVGRGGELSAADPEDDRQEWSREQLYEKLNEDLHSRLQRGEFANIAFTVPHENVNLLKESLRIDLLKRASIFVPKNLVGEDIIDLVDHIQEAA